MFTLVAIRDGRRVEALPGFPTRRDALREARKLNTLPDSWRQPDGRLYHRPRWVVEQQEGTTAESASQERALRSATPAPAS